ADRGDLGLVPVAAADPHPDPAVAPPALDVEARQRPDYPLFEPPHMATDVAPMPSAIGPLQIEHDIGDPLSRPVIGVLPAAAALVDRQAPGIEQIFGPRAGPR